MSRVLACDAVRPQIGIIEEAVAALIGGSVVVMPTETQYSLSARADSEPALKKIWSIKKRPETVKTALFVKDMEMARRFCEINEMAEDLARRFLPGPLTLVLPGRKDQDFVAPGFLSPDGFGIRISSSPVIRAVMACVPFAVTATSANISGDMTPDNVAEIRQTLGDGVDLYLDAGPCRGRVPSTVVKVAEKVAVLRHGVIPEKEIRQGLKETE